MRLLSVALLTAVTCVAQLPSESERLMAAARLWVTVEYFHPYLASRHIDWDQALLKALPGVRTASTPDEFRAALSFMLDQLHDPATHMGEGTQARASIAPQVSVFRTARSVGWMTSTGPETIVLDIAGFPATIRLSETGPVNLASQLKTDAEPSDDAYPSLEQRLLGAIKTWGAIRYFFAYKDLMDEDWDDTFASYLPRIMEARDAAAYNLVLADLLTHCTDTNTAPHSQTLDAYFGVAPVGLRMRLLDKFPIVTQVLDPAALAAGVRPGDVVKRIGNESTTDRFRRFVQYVPASTAGRSGYDTLQRVTNGEAGAEVELAIEDAHGETHVVKLARRIFEPAPERSTEPVRLLPGNIGYLDLERVMPGDLAAALARLKNTKGIIFDLRSAHAPAAGDVASHLTTQAGVAVAMVTTPLALQPDVPSAGIATRTTNTFVVETLGAPRAPLYSGKTIALIDERTIGEAERAGLLLEVADMTEFVGEPSAGAYSTIAELHVPGGITITYSTQDIRHANGGKLQRLGLQPNLLAPATAKGLRAGRDEALDAALIRISGN